MNQKVPELLDLTKSLLDQSVEIVDDSVPSIESVPAKEVSYSIFLRVQMSEALKFGYGAYYSCYHGWGHGGIGAARSIYEILLDIKYINQDEAHKDRRFTRFMDHGAEYLYHKMERIIELGQVVSQEEQDKYTNKYDQLKKKYKNMHEQDVKLGILKAEATPKHRPYNWAGLDLTEKVKKVNLDQFHQLYKDLANLSHVSISALLDAISESTDDQFEVNLNLQPCYTHCSNVLMTTFTCIAGVLEEYMVYFEIEHSSYPILENLWRDYKELLNR
jgi:hypothetical protein